MSVQWFPGHMYMTQKALVERLKEIDVVIELLDARLPGSSANPLLEKLTRQRLKLKVLNKCDLADPIRTETWLAHYNTQPHTQALALNTHANHAATKVLQHAKALAPHRKDMTKPLRLLICGIPNVGKSTLINALVGKKATKTGDEAGVTKQEQRINLNNACYLFDTPGMLWPKILAPKSGYHLAASGAVGRNAYDEEEVALELIHSLKQPYAELLCTRYSLTQQPTELAEQADDLILQHIGKNRAAVMKGGTINIQKAADIILNDFRHHALGSITLETPEEFLQWSAEAQLAEEQLLAERAAKRLK